MDPKTTQNSNGNNKKTERKHEETKKMKENGNHNDATDETVEEVCRQMSKLVDDGSRGGSAGSGSSTESEDLVNAINYNTITSLAALKDILQGDGSDTPETDSFFQHYFMNHCNNLSSRNSITGSPFSFPERRRLSQCMEEDEDDERKESDPPPSIVSSHIISYASHGSFNVKEGEAKEGDSGEGLQTDPCEASGSKRTVMGARHKFLVTTAKPPASPVERALRSQVHNSHTVHFGTKGAEEQRPSVRSIFAGQNLHRDKHYFDSSLVEIRSIVDDTTTSSEDIWVKRADVKPVKPPTEEVRKSSIEAEKEKLKAEAEVLDQATAVRPRAGTWSSQTAKKELESAKKTKKDKESNKKDSGDRRQKRDHRLDASITRSTQSVGERRRRGSADEGQAHQMYQQTIHGTSGVSRRPALFDIFKSKPRGDPKSKQPSIMQQVKAAVQNMTKSGTSAKDPSKVEGKPLDAESVTTTAPDKARDGSAHPHPGSDTRYYHTVTASTTRRPSAMAKVMDIFRGKPFYPGQTIHSESSERRKTRAIAQLQHQYATGSQISRSELFEVWCQFDKENRNSALLDFVLKKLKVPQSDKNLFTLIRSKTSKFSSKVESKWKSAGARKERFQIKNHDWLEGHIIFSTHIVTSEDSEYEQEHVSKAGRPEKSFKSCGDHSKRAKVRYLLESVPANELKYAAEMATRASGSRTAAAVIRSVSESPEAAKSYIAAKENLANQQQYSGEEALALYIDNHFTTRSYKNTRKQALAKGHILYPSYHMLKSVRNDCLPLSDAVKIDEISARVNLQQLLNITAKRLLEVIKPVIKDKVSDGTDLTLVGKWGADGCSAQSLYKQKFRDASNTDEFLFMISFAPITLHVTNDPTRVVWQNPNCSSTRLCRSIAFIFEKETRELVLEET